MAVRAHIPSTLRVEDLTLTVFAPTYFLAMLKETLHGWSIVPGDDGVEPDIMVIHEAEYIQTDARIHAAPLRRTDPIHALNDFFLTLAYLYANHHSRWELVHCAAISREGRNVLLLGDKKSGKSVMAIRHGVGGHGFIADDLLLWNTSRGVFKTIGLPPRLRRPVMDEIIRRTAADAFFAGKDLAYMKVGRYNGVPAAQIIEFDEVRRVKSGAEIEKISLLNYASEIRSRVVSKSYMEFAKPTLTLSMDRS